MNKIIEKAIAEGRKYLAENEVKQLLRDIDIPTTDFQYFQQFSEIDLSRLQFPAVLKICSPRILHKTDVGGVLLNIRDKDELSKAVEGMQQRFPGEGMLVEPMYKGTVEVIIGLINDGTFGPTIMFGVGGIYTEVYKDVTFRIVPLKRVDAEEMISEIKAAPILAGARGVKIDRDQLIDVMLRTSEFAEEISEIIDQMDLNPIFLTEDSVRAIDAKLILR